MDQQCVRPKNLFRECRLAQKLLQCRRKQLCVSWACWSGFRVLVASTNWTTTFLNYLPSLDSQNVGGYSIPWAAGRNW